VAPVQTLNLLTYLKRPRRAGLPEWFSDRTHPKHDVQIGADAIDKKGVHRRRRVLHASLLGCVRQSVAYLRVAVDSNQQVQISAKRRLEKVLSAE